MIGWRNAVISALTGALVLGCSTPPPPQDLVAGRWDARCDRNVRCGVWEDHDACVASYEYGDRDQDATLRADIASGVVIVDPTAGAQCLDALASASCLRGDATPPSCVAAFRGTEPDGAACCMQDECASGACGGDGRCFTPPALATLGEACGPPTCTPDLYCQGVCKPLLAVGAACIDVNSACADGAPCTLDPATSAYACPALPTEGMPCLILPSGAGWCGTDGLTCSGQTCVKRPRTGESCAGFPGNPCVDGDTCVGAETCQPLPGDGEPCSNLADDFGDLCEPPFECSPAGICGVLPDDTMVCKLAAS
jgi:hypothetical protein